MSRLGDEERQSFAREMEEARLERQRLDLRAVLRTDEGRRVIYRLLAEVTGIFGGSFVADPLMTAFHEGRRDVGITLIGESQAADVESYWLMLQEAHRAALRNEEAQASHHDEERDHE